MGPDTFLITLAVMILKQQTLNPSILEISRKSVRIKTQ
jgi:hypothetical protein